MTVYVDSEKIVYYKWKVIYEPNPDCKWCQGTSIKQTQNKEHPERPCVCVCA